uniref:LIM zinc-binding domain-containing protein n=1 Tax=Timema bartmani TaxID=61472 RepID=A0A7R9HXD9_9NEOP|nr:unnamed protein product [Timema bartmani]
MPGSNGTTGSPRVPVSVAPYRDRRASSSSDTSLPDTNLRQLSSESVEHIPTRTATVSASKPAANPLQFIKVGPANLYKAAQEQIKKVEEVKKLKEEVRNEEEDWQSNLDNWKSSRRKRQEHIIERVVEVKKLELEEHDRNRRRSKTFNEMMEDRNRAGRKLSLQVFKDEDANDLSDLGIGTSSGKSSISEDYNHDDNLSVDGREHLDKYHYETPNGEERKNGLNGHHDDDTSTTATISSPEPEEYTYERAIQSYVNFTETRVKSRTMNNINNNMNGNQGNEKLTNNVNAEKLPNGTSATKKIPPPVAPRKESAAKIEERLSALERRRSSIDSDTTKKLGLQKVDVLKRRELFEKASESEASKPNRVSGDFSKTKSIKDRLSHLEKHNEDANGNKRRHSTDVSSSVKDRLSQFKKSSENISLKESPKLIHRISTGDSSSSQSIQERLSSLEKNVNSDRELSPNKLLSEDFSHSIKDRLSNLDSAINRENGSKLTPDKDPSFQTKLANFRNTETNLFEEEMDNRLFFPNTINPDRLMNPEQEIYQTKRQQFHRSLDNLDAEISNETQKNDTSFERVQSLEDLECCSNTRNYPPSSSSTEMLALSTQSGDTDREDSGIHTADVSCSVSQADEPVEDSEIVPITSNLAPLLESVANSIDAFQHETQSIHKNRNILESPLEDQDINKDTSKFNSVVDCDASNLPATSKDIDVPSYQKVEDINNFVSSENFPTSPLLPMTSGDGSAITYSVNTSSLLDNYNSVTTYSSSSLNDTISLVEPVSNGCEVVDISGMGDLSGTMSVETNQLLVEVAHLPSSPTSSSCEILEKTTLEADKIKEELQTPVVDTSEFVFSNDVPNPANVSQNVLPAFNESIDMSEDSFETSKTLSFDEFQPESVGSTDFESCRSNASSPESLPMEVPEKMAAAVAAVCSRDKVSSASAEYFMSKKAHDGNNVRSPQPYINVPANFKESAMSLGGKLEQQEDMFISSGRMEHTDGNKSSYVFVEDNLSKEICDKLDKGIPSEVQDENKPEPLVVEGGNFISEDIKDSQLFSEQDKVTGNYSNTLIFEKQKDDSVSFLNTSNQCNIEKDVIYSIANQIPTLNLSSDIEFIADLAFPLGPPTSAEPPKEKPPPPPTDLSDEDMPPPVTSLKRLDSTKRIKKEIRKKRSDFLGIEGGNDDGYLEPELKLAPPPDMVMFLVEERRSEQQMYRQSICSESDSALGETTESRDSGVELDRGHPDDMWTTSQPAFSPSSSQHSRQNSELYGNASITSEEDEISKREREIIEILEKEEKWRYGSSTTSEQNDIGEKLAAKLRQLEQEKQRLEWEKVEEEKLLQARQHELQQQEASVGSPELTSLQSNTIHSGDQLRAERDRLQRENEALERQKEELRLYEQQQQKQQTQQQHWGSTSALPPLNQRWDSTRLSLQDISHQVTDEEVYTHLYGRRVENHLGKTTLNTPDQDLITNLPVIGSLVYRESGAIDHSTTETGHTIPAPAPVQHLTQSPINNYRLSLPNLQQDGGIQTTRVSPSRRAPPPIPPAKPLRVVSQEQNESIRSSRVPSADHLLSNGSVPSQIGAQTGSQQMSRQTLQALSAAPRSRLISTDNWMQAKRKPEGQRNNNYQHWLVQEAEHRRITEQQQRAPRRPPPPIQQQVWNSQLAPRQDKPLPDSIIQTLTQRVQNRVGLVDNKNIPRRRLEDSPSREAPVQSLPPANNIPQPVAQVDNQEKMLSVSGKKKCSHCGEELGRGAAMIIESLRLFYHIDCFKCCVCHVQLGDGLMGTDVRVRNNKLHCHNCYSSDDG